ncbi:MAG TPA: ATPase domain-containing protein [Thermoplasmata archaeon]|nr:ATPase domain-containing protein [Thermoplasmata archaeon]
MSTGPIPPARPEGTARLSTGVAALDTMLTGGLLPGRPYLVVGPSGTGKTSLALQFLVDGVRKGERCLLVTLEEPPNEVRQNHRGLLPELDRVFVFDAIPDVMRYERAPFKDIAQVRESVPFGLVAPSIRKTAELASVEVTFSALEQTLKMEIARRAFSRIVVDSLTALQYFCMKGFDETLGAQTFLRFLSDLRITTLLTVEAPLEDVETPERLLARGEIRLFRWELEGKTVRAIGVEKFRGSQHDARLHPYRISSQGIDVNLDVTISRDTRQEIRPEELHVLVAVPPETVDGLTRLEQDTLDLASLGVSPAPVLEAIDSALRESRSGRLDGSVAEMVRARALVLALFDDYRNGPGASDASVAARRLVERVASVRAGVPPTPSPPASGITERLESLASQLHDLLRSRATPPSEPPAPRSGPAASRPAPGPAGSVPHHPPATEIPSHPTRPEPPPLPTRRQSPPSARAAVVPSAATAGSAEAPPHPPLPTPGAGARPSEARSIPPADTAPPRAPPVPPPTPEAPAGATAPPPEILAAAEATAPKKKRRTSAAAPRRRTPKPATLPPSPAPGPEPSVAIGGTVAAPVGAAPVAEEVKSKKRRAPARKKAPVVTGASPGTPPPEEHRLKEPVVAQAAPPPDGANSAAPAESSPPPPRETPGDRTIAAVVRNPRAGPHAGRRSRRGATVPGDGWHG